jgi:signal peptidase II
LTLSPDWKSFAPAQFLTKKQAVASESREDRTQIRLGNRHRNIYACRMNSPNPYLADHPEKDAFFGIAGVPISRHIVFLLLASIGGAADLLSKEAIFRWRGLPGQSDVWWVIEGYFGIETAVNIGAVFGLGAGRGVLFAGLSIVAAVAIIVWLFWFQAARQWWLTVAMGCVLGGIIGNLYDRLGLWWTPGLPLEWRSGVRDWILWQAGENYKWPNFNIADSLLVCGAGMLMWRSFFPDDEHENRIEPSADDQ